jgi:hypothetical protein
MRLEASSVRAIAQVAALLGEQRDHVVFVGGATIPLFVTDPAAGIDRPTDDVDVVVEATSPMEYYALADRLRERVSPRTGAMSHPLSVGGDTVSTAWT